MALTTCGSWSSVRRTVQLKYRYTHNTWKQKDGQSSPKWYEEERPKETESREE